MCYLHNLLFKCCKYLLMFPKKKKRKLERPCSQISVMDDMLVYGCEHRVNGNVANSRSLLFFFDALCRILISWEVSGALSQLVHVNHEEHAKTECVKR